MKKVLIIIIILVTGFYTYGQESLWSFTYNMAVPMGETKDMVGKYSFRGIGIEGRKFIDNNFSMGGSVGWNVFYEKQDKMTTEHDNITLTGTHFNTINAFPFYVNASYYLNEGSYVRPYLGMNVGAIYTLYRKDIGLYRFEEKPLKFGIAPEIGILFETYSGSSFTINFKYNYGAETSDTDPLSYLGINVGFIWLY